MFAAGPGSWDARYLHAYGAAFSPWWRSAEGAAPLQPGCAARDGKKKKKKKGTRHYQHGHGDGGRRPCDEVFGFQGHAVVRGELRNALMDACGIFNWVWW